MYTYTSICMALGVAAALFIALFIRNDPPDRNQVTIPLSHRFREVLTHLVTNRRQQLLIFTSIYRGVTQGFIVGDFTVVSRPLCMNSLLHRYSFERIDNIQLLKTLWEMKNLLITSNFFFSHNVYYSIRKLYPHLLIFFTSYLYLVLNWKSPKLAYEVKG